MPRNTLTPLLPPPSAVSQSHITTYLTRFGSPPTIVGGQGSRVITPAGEPDVSGDRDIVPRATMGGTFLNEPGPCRYRPFMPPRGGRPTYGRVRAGVSRDRRRRRRSRRGSDGTGSHSPSTPVVFLSFCVRADVLDDGTAWPMGYRFPKKRGVQRGSVPAGG